MVESWLQCTIGGLGLVLVVVPCLMALYQQYRSRKCRTVVKEEERSLDFSTTIPTTVPRCRLCCRNKVELQLYIKKPSNGMPTIVVVPGNDSAFAKPYQELKTSAKAEDQEFANQWDPVGLKKRGSYAKYAKRLGERGYGIVGCDPNNTGRSQRTWFPFGFGTIEKWDVKAVVEYTHAEVAKGGNIYISTQSMGGALAIHACSTWPELPVRALILESPPAYVDVALFRNQSKKMFGCALPSLYVWLFLLYYKIFFFFGTYGVCVQHTKTVASKIDKPVLHIYSTKDKTVPKKHSTDLDYVLKNRQFGAYKPVVFHGNHVQACYHLDLPQVIDDFINEAQSDDFINKAQSVV